MDTCKETPVKSPKLLLLRRRECITWTVMELNPLLYTFQPPYQQECRSIQHQMLKWYKGKLDTVELLDKLAEERRCPARHFHAHVYNTEK